MWCLGSTGRLSGSFGQCQIAQGKTSKKICTMKLPVEYSISSSLIQNPDCCDKMECRKGATTYIFLEKNQIASPPLVTRNLVEFFMTAEIGFPRIAGHGTILSLGTWFLKVGYPKITRFHSYGPCTSGKENEMLWEPLSILTVPLLHCIHAHLWNCTWRRLRLANTVHTVSKAWNVGLRFNSQGSAREAWYP